MIDFNILVIEDEKAYVDFLSKIFDQDFFIKNKFNINYVTQWEQADSWLNDKRYDLIIADLYIYKNTEEQEKLTRGNYFCLDELLKKTESVYPPSPIIVFTSRDDLNKLSPYQTRIWDFWDKKKVDDQFAIFRIKKLKTLIEKESPNAIICRAIRDNIKKKISLGISPPFHKDILNLLDTYETFFNILSRNDQINFLISSLTPIATQLGFSDSFRNGLATLAQTDAPISAIVHSYRPHLFHCIHTFLIGYYLFNLSGIDWLKILKGNKNIFSQGIKLKIANDIPKEEAEKEFYNEINSAWFAASLLHDVGIPLQYFESISDKFYKSVLGLDISSSLYSSPKINFQDKFLDDLVATFNELVSPPDFTNLIKDEATNLDHGVGSAIFINSICLKESIKTLGSDYEFSPLKIASQATALHNLFIKDNFPMVDMSIYPILAMLIFCDAIQAWDREKIVYSSIEGDYIENVQITKFFILERENLGPEIDIEIKYNPHSTIATHKPSFINSFNKLQEILQKQVINPLRKVLCLNCKETIMPKFNISFKMGVKQIETFSIPVKK